MRQRKIILQRQRNPFWLWSYLVGCAIAFVVIIYGLASDGRSIDGLDYLLLLVMAVVALAVVYTAGSLLARKILFLDNYISFRSWFGIPVVYRYEDVIDIKAVEVDSDFGEEFFQRLFRWEFEDNTTVYFADGKKLRIPTSAASPSKVKRLIESKVGIKFDSTLKLKLPKNARTKHTRAPSRRRTRSKKRVTNERDST